VADERIEHLAWDSDFFGIEIGRVTLDGLTGDDLLALDDEARSRGIQCVYGRLDPEPPQPTYLVQTYGWRFVEANIMITVHPDRRADNVSPPEITARLGNDDDLPVLFEAVPILANWSRYAVDPHFGPDAARRMHEAWLRRAATADDDQWQLVVAEDETGIVGFGTQTLSPEPLVDFIGTTRRGSGAPYACIEYSREWARPHTLVGGPIAARNVTAMRFVEHCGYRFHRVSYSYHRWLDEAPMLNPPPPTEQAATP
jgi:hypothetical protein